MGTLMLLARYWLLLFRQSTRAYILLPLYYNPEGENNNCPRKPIEPEKIYQTMHELTTKFGGVTSTQSLNDGLWDKYLENGTKKRYEDTTKTLYIDFKPSLKNFEFLTQYKKTLQKRFDQKIIYVTLAPITVL